MISPADLRVLVGGIDIYLFDQVLRGRIEPGRRIMDAGCGGGRNLVYFMRAGYEVSGIDADAGAIASVRGLAAQIAPHLDPQRFRAESLMQSSFPDHCADVVISSAVLHFAGDDEAFEGALRGSWRLLAPGGLFFARTASTIGIEAQVSRVGPGNRRCRLPDGSDRYLVDETCLMEWTDRLGGRQLDPLKTTVVQGQRAMTTWVLQKLAEPLD